jgi:hypothetical protein
VTVIVATGGPLPAQAAKAATKTKQFIGQAAMDEQQPSMVFSEGGFLWGQQSMSSMEDDMWSIGADMDDMSADFAPAAALAMVGRRATDRASKYTSMARTRPSSGIEVRSDR